MSIDTLSLGVKDIYRCVEDETCGRSVRLALIRGEILRAPRHASRLSILSGTAWVSNRGKDYLIGRGEKLPLETSHVDPALISAVGETPLFLELE
jgi:hypothetical protein